MDAAIGGELALVGLSADPADYVPTVAFFDRRQRAWRGLSNLAFGVKYSLQLKLSMRCQPQ
jgi:hypothetical protein